MDDECRFCHGLVLADERDHIVLDGHGDHVVYMHKHCGVSGDAIRGDADSPDRVEVTCPECGTVETTEL